MAKKRQTFSVPQTPRQVIRAEGAAQRIARRAAGVELVTMKVIRAEDLGELEHMVGLEAPIYSGPMETDFSCGSCGVVLAEGAFGDDLDDTALECPKCGSLNVVPADWTPARPL